jgi:hypothetical protein
MHKYTALVCPALGAVGGTLALLAATRQEVRLTACTSTSISVIRSYLGTVGISLALLAATRQEVRWLHVPVPVYLLVVPSWVQWACITLALLAATRQEVR